MWGELPKFFGKSFAVGFFLPSTAIFLALLGLCYGFGYGEDVTRLLKNADWLGAAISVFLLWMGGVTLLALNRPIIRFLEGYGRWNPLRVLSRRRRRQFALLDEAVATLRRERDRADAERIAWPDGRANLYAKLVTASLEYPDYVNFVLPTRFGNTIRAFEVYPRVIYGLEAIDAWPRLLAIIPTDYRQAIEDSKAQVDFWVNLWFGAVLTIVCYVAFCISTHSLMKAWIPVAALGVACLALAAARPAAAEWGTFVKSTFDLFRGDLAKSSG